MRPLATVLTATLTACLAFAEPATEKTEDAQFAVTGTILDIASKTEKIGPKKDGTEVRYTAKLEVTAVAKGNVLAGDRLAMSWSHIPKKPTGDFDEPFNHDYKVAKGDKVRVYLKRISDNEFEGSLRVIYHKDGMQK